MIRRLTRAARLTLVVASVVAVGCGKKGPPLPPLILLPNAPADFTAIRRGGEVDLSLKVPAANTDGSKPADLARVDIYAWTVPGPVSADQVIVRGTRVATFTVNKPPDPDEPPPATPAPKGPGLDQSDPAFFSDTIAADDPQGHRVYVAVGYNRRGRRGALSPAVAVPLVPPPAAPGALQVAYDEKAITVSWPAVAATDTTPISYAVYTPGTPPAPLTPQPIGELTFADKAIEWEQERCYEVRAVQTVDRVRIESAPSPARCVTLHDTFAPTAPDGLVSVASEGAVSLIWNANTERDLGGYIVLRAIAPATELTPVTPAPIPDTNFRDTVAAGARVTYAVQAVDKAGNTSVPSATISETAR
ncbi:MAG: hypothetical protein JSU08_05830 [Acidobacteria bacterium]|nr:hypothetical protein [Acidobacteriota bacterium]